MALTAAGCDSKAGVAAVANGHRITESTLSKYLTPTSRPIPLQSGAMPARTFVLRTLIANEVLPELLSKKGGPVTDSELQEATGAALQGGTEADLLKQITGVGLSPKFEPVLLHNYRLLTLLEKRFGSQQEVLDELAKLDAPVSVSPRYGSWSNQNLGLTELSGKQIPANVTLTGRLPGDKTPAATP